MYPTGKPVFPILSHLGAVSEPNASALVRRPVGRKTSMRTRCALHKMLHHTDVSDFLMRKPLFGIKK